MFTLGSVDYRFALPEEYEAIHSLNHAAFCVDLGQHETSASGMRVDARNRTNRYVTAWRRDRLVGMMSVGMARPYSVESRCNQLESVLKDGVRYAEFRLFTVVPQMRMTLVPTALLLVALSYCERLGVGGVLLSAIMPSHELYERVGFDVIAPVSHESRVRVVPMLATIETMVTRMSPIFSRMRARMRWHCPASALGEPHRGPA